ncbi:hypothetical protein [Shimia sagamensis]|uniref:hypothetical protein n=1 Tax=Shimia sagamensis TaxID=1566352 RepID=UPI0024B79EE6|nr:hypothetical protein [Shimia sagamensis]
MSAFCAFFSNPDRLTTNGKKHLFIGYLAETLPVSYRHTVALLVAIYAAYFA